MRYVHDRQTGNSQRLVESQIIGNPPGTAPVHQLASVAVRVDLDPYLSMKALADYSSLSRRTLQDLVNDTSDPIPSFRVGGKLLVRKSDFDRWMGRRRNQKPREAARLAAADAQALLKARH
jgi:excisionase family DNA binding protein